MVGRTHRKEGFKASEGCLGVCQEAKGKGIPSRWNSRSQGLEVGMYHVRESTRLISGQSESTMTPECECGAPGAREAGTQPWLGDNGLGEYTETTQKVSLSKTEVARSEFYSEREFRQRLRQSFIHQKGIKEIRWPKQTEQGPGPSRGQNLVEKPKWTM